MKIEIYVQARMGSTRLPGKVMRTVLGRPLLDFLIERLEQVQEADAVVVLTTFHPADDEIVNFCRERKVLCYRGPEEDVLTRYHRIALQRQPDAIVRITADCPLIDPEIIDLIIRTYRDLYPNIDYVSNSLVRTYPRGLDVEIFSLKALDEAFREALHYSEREHVTPYIYQHTEKFRLKNVALSIPLDQHRWTVDTIEDFTLIRLILENLYLSNPQFRLSDIVQLVKTHPEWSEINAHVQQKLIS